MPSFGEPARFIEHWMDEPSLIASVAFCLTILAVDRRAVTLDSVDDTVETSASCDDSRASCDDLSNAAHGRLSA